MSYILNQAELASYSLAIREQANKVFYRFKLPCSRGQPRKLALLFCLIQAHRELNEVHDPRQLARDMKLKDKDISKAYRKYDPQGLTCTSFVDPHSLILSYAQALDLPEHIITKANLLCQRCLQLDQGLYNERPQNVAAAVLAYCLTAQGTGVSQLLLEVANITIEMLGRTFQRVGVVDNSSEL